MGGICQPIKGSLHVKPQPRQVSSPNEFIRFSQLLCTDPSSTASAGVPRGQAGTLEPPLPWEILVLGMLEVGRCDGNEPMGHSPSLHPDFLGMSWLGDVPMQEVNQLFPAAASSPLRVLVIFSLVSAVGCTEKPWSIKKKKKKSIKKVPPSGKESSLALVLQSKNSDEIITSLWNRGALYTNY